MKEKETPERNAKSNFSYGNIFFYIVQQRLCAPYYSEEINSGRLLGSL